MCTKAVLICVVLAAAFAFVARWCASPILASPFHVTRSNENRFVVYWYMANMKVLVADGP